MKNIYKITSLTFLLSVSLFFVVSEENVVLAQSCKGVRSEIGKCEVNSAGRCVVTSYDSRACAYTGGLCQTLITTDACGWKYNGTDWVCGVVQGTGSYKPCCDQVLSCVDANACKSSFNGTILRYCDAYTADCQLPVSAPGCTPTGGDAGPKPTYIPTPTSSQTAYCQNILAYDSNWVLLTNTQLTQTKAGNRLNYCVKGYSNTGTFDMARFTINGTLYPNTTLLRPGTTTDYCQAYTVPTAIYSFDILGEVHNTTVGWVQ